MEPRIDYGRRVFITRSGVELQLQRVSPVILERIHGDRSGKPKVPRVEVKMAGGHTRVEDNPNDPDYAQALKEWNQDHNSRIVKYVFVHGIANETPVEFVQEHAEFFPDATASDMKYLWIGSLVDEESTDIQKLIEAITGQNAITEEGLEQATASFPGDGERNGRELVAVRETARDDPDLASF